MITIYSHTCGPGHKMDQYLPEGKDWTHTGVYLHGELEQLVGYDIVYVPISKRGDPTEDNQDAYWLTRYNEIRECLPVGIHNVIVKADGKDYEAKAYVYTDRYHKPSEGGRLRGLVVLENDIESVTYAKECYKKEEPTL